MPEILKIKPVSGQVRYRGTVSPPNYNIIKTEIAADLGGKLAEVFNLTSRDIVFNQNTASAAYLVFRYFMSVEGNFFRYLEVSLGVDQVEILFVNPPSVAVLRQEFFKVLDPLIKISKPKIAQHYFEITIDASAQENNVAQFLDRFVTLQLTTPHKLTSKGVVFNVETEPGGSLHVNCQNSAVVPDGIFLYFTYTLKKTISDTKSLEDIFQSVHDTYYPQVQTMTKVKVLEEP